MEKEVIGIVHINIPSVSPYLKNYIDILQSTGKQFEMIYWDRTGKQETYPNVPCWLYSRYAPDNLPRLLKIRYLVGFFLYARKIIRRRKYSRLIVLTTLTAQLLSGLLRKHYYNKFFLDIRDHTYEHHKFYLRREARLVDASWGTSISSEGFLNFLPPSDKYILAHNLYADDLVKAESFTPAVWRPGQPVRVVFAGIMKYLRIDKHIMLKLGWDKRFELTFHGNTICPGLYEKLQKKSGPDTVRMTGRYMLDQKAQLLAPAHLLHNYFEGLNARYAMSNRYYDGLVYGIPMLANPETYCGQKIRDKGLGITLTLEDADFTNKLYQAYTEFDHNAFRRACQAELQQVVNQQREYLNKVKTFINAKDDYCYDAGNHARGG